MIMMLFLPSLSLIFAKAQVGATKATSKSPIACRGERDYDADLAILVSHMCEGTS